MAKKKDWERNTSGMVKAAKKKRESAIENTEKAIRQLIKENKPINFHSVANAANVSVPWLYKEVEIKERIQQLREQQRLKIKLDEGKKPSTASQDAIIATLKKKINQQDEEIKQLREQLKVAYGQVRTNQDSSILVESLRTRCDELERQLQKAINQSASTTPKSKSKVTSFSKKTLSISDSIQDELDQLKIKLNSTLTETIKNKSEEVVLAALEALKDQLQKADVPNPGGWLNKAIQEEWTVEEGITKQESPRPQERIVKAHDKPQKEQVSLTQLKKLSSIFNKDE
jgi:hypothetical protein